MGEKKQPALRQKLLTSVDVARKAGVSRTAVSYVLNGIQNAHVSEETRVRVLQAAQELGYHMNTSAQALRKGQSNEICILSSVPMSANDTEIFVSAQQHASLHGYVPVVYFVGGLTTGQQRELLLRVIARRPLALLLLGPDCLNTEYITLAQRMGIEYILLIAAEPIEEQFQTTLSSISLPTREIGYLAARHLLERGHCHLGILHPPDPRHKLAFLQRLQGMRDAIAKAETQSEALRLDIFPMHLSMSDAHSLVDTYLTGAERPTGIYAFNDEYALPLMGALSDRGIRVPQDIAIVGTDNVSYSAFVRPALTTISFDNVALGRRVIEMLIALQKGEPLPEELTRPLIPELILRAST
jgi:LacI family transcriptional regulator